VSSGTESGDGNPVCSSEFLPFPLSVRGVSRSNSAGEAARYERPRTRDKNKSSAMKVRGVGKNDDVYSFNVRLAKNCIE
jgi:hypothetical protein